MTRRLQAVIHERLGLVGVAFYQPGRIEIGRDFAVQVDKACVMLAREQNGRLEVTVANPENEGARCE